MTPPEALDSDIESVKRALLCWSGEPTQPEPKNMRGVRTREHLLVSATRVFATVGYVDCTVEDLLKAAEVSRATFYAHFKSKKAIFAAVIERSIRTRLTSTDVSGLDVPLVRDRIQASVRQYLELFVQPMDLSLVIEQTAYHDPSFRSVRLLIRDSFARRVAMGIRRQQARGIADPTVDPDEAGLMIVSMMTHYALTELGWRERRPNEEMVELLTRFWVNGISLQEDADSEGS